MTYRTDAISPGNIYHVYNRGVNRSDIFLDDMDRQRFCELLVYYMPEKSGQSFSMAMRNVNKDKRSEEIFKRKTKSGEGGVDLLSYCLMNNHIHLLLCENTDQGISKYTQKVFTSYSKYFNTRHKRDGPLFSGRFRVKRIDSNDYFLHVTRYIHINPYVARMVNDPFLYRWSSLKEYSEPLSRMICHTDTLRKIMPRDEYRQFVTDYGGYARDIESFKDLFIDS